jgi:DNA-binding protein H-NS
MAKKAKRRGRPSGSKNKKKVKAPKNLASMDVGQLRAHIADLEETLAAKVQQQRKYLEGQLAGLQIYASNKAAAAVRTVMRVPKADGRSGPRAKPVPKYRSRKDKSLRWTGRGLMPRWMREEMKGTKLTKDHFLIKGA